MINGRTYGPKQQKVVKEGKEISKRGQVTQKEAEDHVRHCREVNIGPDKARIDTARIDTGHMDRMNPSVPADGVSGQPHLQVPPGKNSHVPIKGDEKWSCLKMVM